MKISKEAIETERRELEALRKEQDRRILERARSSVIFSIAVDDPKSAVLTAFEHDILFGHSILEDVPEETLKQGADALMNPSTPVKGADNDGYERRKMYEAAKTAYGLLGLSGKKAEAEEKIKKDLKWRNEWDNLSREY